MEKLLTVVVPTYNTEKFLENCVDSLLQTQMVVYTEIIIVDDGSKDSSGVIADRYASEYPDIVKVIHKENGGHGSAINAGIELAKGKYFKVVDSDDTVAPVAYESYLRRLETLDCDLIATPFTCVWYQVEDGTKIEKIVREQKRSIEGAEKLTEGTIYSFTEVADKLHIRMHEWTIRTEILKRHDICLMEHAYYVDMQYILYPVPWIQTVCILPENVYRYRLGAEGQSVSIKSMQKNREQHRKVLHSLVDFYKQREKAGDGKAILAYLAKGMAKMEADEVQTALSLPIGKEAKKELLLQERYLKKECLAAYRANQKFSVWLLRWSGYLLYLVAVMMWRLTRR